MKIVIEKSFVDVQKRNNIYNKQQARRKEFCKGILSESSAKPRVALTYRIFYKNCAHSIQSPYRRIYSFAHEGK